MNRRGFVKLIGQAAAAIVVARQLPAGTFIVDEMDVAVHKKKEWVTDEGDYFMVNLPDGKVLSGERFDKPVLVILGANSAMQDCEINGFVNLYGRPYFSFSGNSIFGGQYQSIKDRPALSILPGTSAGHVHDIDIKTAGQPPIPIKFQITKKGGL